MQFASVKIGVGQVNARPDEVSVDFHIVNLTAVHTHRRFSFPRG